MSTIRSVCLLWKVLGRQRRIQFIGLLVLSLISAIAEVANLGALFPVLKLLANPQKSIESLGFIPVPFSQLSQQQLLLSLGACFLSVVVFSTIVRVLTIQIQLRLGALIAADLGDQVFSAVLNKPFNWHLENNSSRVLGHLTKDVDQVYGSIQSLLVIVVNLSVVLLLAISLIGVAPQVMLIAAPLLAIFYGCVYRLTRSRFLIDGQRLTLNYEASLQVAQEALGGIRDIILDRSQSFFLDAYKLKNRNYRLASASINTKAQIPRYLIEGFVILLIVGISLSLAISGQSIDKQLPVLGILSLGAYRLLQPLQQCFGSFSSLKANQASLSRLHPYLSVKNNHFNRLPISAVSNDLTPPDNFPIIELANVSFRYSPDAPLVLHQLSFSIAKGESIALVGSTGSGKSTCSDLILGLLVPTSGHILVCGNHLHQDQELLAAWQAHVAHVPQNIYLTDASFAANIAFGIPLDQINHDLVRHVAHEAQISNFIESSPYGYDTVVGERGVRLSGGQRQRIGIARALYKKADLLVLDEATSALDNITENELMSTINALSLHTTVVVVAHRLSTVKTCSRILLLDQGSVVSTGTYDQLYQHCSKFRDLALAGIR
jgi:ABC-type multidrug transport system fused ATPase/permease subunit